MANPQMPDPTLPWPIGNTALRLIALSEGCVLRAYKCPAGVWTIGWGHTENVVEGMRWDQKFADQVFCNDLTSFVGKVRSACRIQPNEKQLGALVSFAYNIGMGWEGPKKPKNAKDGFRQSTVLRQHNAGNPEAAARAFSLWNKAGGKVMPGLVTRRLAEASLYLTTPVGIPLHQMPQAVEPESSLNASPIAISGKTLTGAGGLTILGTLAEKLDSLKGYVASVKGFIADTLGVPTDWVLPILLIVLGLVVWYWRHKQRDEGFA